MGRGWGGWWITCSTVTCSSISCWRPPESGTWFAALHVTDTFSSPDASVFSGGFISLLPRKKSPVWQHPKAPLQAKHQLYFSFMALSFPRHLTAFWQVSYLQDAFERGFHSSFRFCHRISFFGGLLSFIYYYLWVFLLFSFDYSFCFLTATFSNLKL